MNESAEAKVQKLMLKYGWYEGIAHALVDADGKCVYCGENLLVTRLGYSSIVMDHLLPTAIYPAFEKNIENHVLSCASCNWMKSKYDPLFNGESDEDMLQKRDILIERCRNHLKPKIDARYNEWKSIKNLIS